MSWNNVIPAHMLGIKPLLREQRELANKSTTLDMKTSRWASDEEAEFLFDLIRDNDIDRMWEVGTANGWTAMWAAAAGAKVETYDIADRVKIYDHAMVSLGNTIDFKAIGSPECFSLFVDIKGRTLFFIDGDHTRSGVTRDVQLAVSKMRPGDFLVVHDTIRETPVRNFWAEFRHSVPGEFRDFETYNGLGVYFIPKENE